MVEQNRAFETGNEQFWQGLSSKSGYIQQEFILSSQFLSTALGEAEYGKVMHSPLEKRDENTNTYVSEYLAIEKPPETAGYIEQFKYSIRLAFAVKVQTDINLANNINRIIDENIDDIQYIFGFINGDFNKDPTVAQVIVGGLISMIPVADQICDIRDLLASVIVLSDEEERTPENWLDLALVGIGVIPFFGSVFKTIAKLISSKIIKTREELFKAVEQLESYCRKLGFTPFWGDNPERWLSTKPWAEIGQKAKQVLNQYLIKLQALLKSYGSSNPEKRFGFDGLADKYATAIKDIMANIGRYIDDLCRQLENTCHEIMGQPKLSVAGGHGNGMDIHIGGSPNEPTRVTHTQPSSKIAFARMKEHKVGCFEPVNTPKARANARINIDKGHPPQAQREKWTEDQYLKWETDRQLEMQQNALNNMTVKDYEEGRALYKEKGRGNGLDQEKARREYEKELKDRYYKEYSNNPNISPIEAVTKAEADAKDVMSTMAALHNPDQYIGGIKSEAPITHGLKNVNSSLGSGWKNIPKDEEITRVASMDNAIKDIDPRVRDTTKLNMKLERCK
ncbi:polymorphic toxin type 15 domain-containing protein [Acinetobacter sp.]|uniref:polymorphic toxin type 15 domain-containing protein n=1 Tax=Acinetobacter sp. TaxID=472 RepID=UPI0031E39622